MQRADWETLVARLEQQLQSFEQLHSGELQTLQQQLDALQKIQQDELSMLREQLRQLQERSAADPAAEEKRAAEHTEREATAAATPVELTVTRREQLTGRLPSFNTNKL